MEHASLIRPKCPRDVEVLIRRLAAGPWAVVFPSPIPPYAFTNLLGWLDEPPDIPKVGDAVGWYTAPGDGTRYFLAPEAGNSGGDTLVGTTQDGRAIQVYLPDTTLSSLATLEHWQDERQYDVDGGREVERFRMTVDADESFGNVCFEVAATRGEKHDGRTANQQVWQRVLLLRDPGPQRAKVIIRVRQLLGLSMSDARTAIESGDLELSRSLDELSLDRLSKEFADLGATVEFIRVPLT